MTYLERVIVSAYTGYLMCDFSDMHKYIIIVLSIIFLCAVIIGIAALISVISKKAKEKQKEYWEKTEKIDERKDGGMGNA